MNAPRPPSEDGGRGEPTSLVDQVAEAMTGWPLSHAPLAEDREAWRATARSAMRAVADWLIAEGEAEQRRYERVEVMHALSPLTCNRLYEARHFAAILRDAAP